MEACHTNLVDMSVDFIFSHIFHDDGYAIKVPTTMITQTTLARIPRFQHRRLQAVLNAAASH